MQNEQNNKVALLKASQTKKGQQVFCVAPWNFLHGVQRKEKHSRNEKGFSVYTPHTVDQYRISEYTIYSVGTKQMYLCDENGMRGRMTNVINDEFNGCFVATKEEAISLVYEMDAADEYSINNLEIIYKQF